MSTTDTPAADFTSSSPAPSHMERLWDTGQRHLAAGRYVAARRELEAAEALAWRRRDPAALGRLYLPLMEARRQIRLNAAEGLIVISDRNDPGTERKAFAQFLQRSAGTFLLACRDMCKIAGSVQYAARRTGACLEALLILDDGRQRHLATLADPTFAGGLPIRTTRDEKDLIDPEVSDTIQVPLPPPGLYDPAEPAPRGLHALARESLLVAWEALALRWQSRHPFRPPAPSAEAAWEEIAWLRLALRVDPACEPIAMRLMALAGALQRG